MIVLYLREFHNSLSSYPQRRITLKTAFRFLKMIIGSILVNEVAVIP